MSKIRNFDAHEAAPTSIRDLYKFYQKLPSIRLECDSEIIDPRGDLDHHKQGVIHAAGTIPCMSLNAAYSHLGIDVAVPSSAATPDVLVYEFDNLPGRLSNQPLYERI